MPWLPDLGETPETETWSSSQKQSYVILTYTMILMYAFLLALALCNFFQFVFRTADRCQASHPLLVFYILVFGCLITDIFYSVLAVKVSENYRCFLTILPGQK